MQHSPGSAGPPGSDFLALDPATAPERGRTEWLAGAVRAAILEGVLAPGATIPASRELARDLSFSRGTVVEALRRLSEEGLLVTRRGAGTVVADVAPAAVPAAVAPAASELLNISEGAPDVTAFPRAAWLRAERRVLAEATARELGYADPRGALPLRESLARWLARSRGLAVAPDQLLITGGVSGALSLLAQVLAARGLGDWAIEEPGARGARRVLQHWLGHVRAVAVDDEGLDVAALAATPARVVVVTPAHQFPTGVVLSPGRRRELIAWAGRADGYVVEDDYDAEYRYDRAPVRAMHAAAPDRIVHVSSLSKMLAPALRIGWMVAPDALRDDLVRQRWATDLGSPALPQLVLADLIDTGVLERQLRALRTRHRRRRDAAVESLQRHFPGCRIEGVAAGLHLLVLLPPGLDADELSARAREAGIAVQSLSTHRVAPGPPGLVIGYGPHPPARLDAALATLARLAPA